MSIFAGGYVWKEKTPTEREQREDKESIMLQDLNEISDGKIYDINDMARLACNDCEGCNACCEQMGTSVILDPMDVWRLTVATGKTFEGLLADAIELNVADGMILPNLRMAGEKERCVFLNEEGRCSIHALRPGLCRVFPLGRIYEEQKVRYFLQRDACQKKERSKVKIAKWLDAPEQKKYEQFLLSWHGLRKKLESFLADCRNEQLAKNLNLHVLNQFFVMPYRAEEDFYTQFYARVDQMEQMLQ